HCSESSYLIWGIPNEESIGKHITELDSASPYPELLETGKAVMGKVHLINGKSCITDMIPLFDRKDQIVGAFGTIIYRGVDKLKNLIRENVINNRTSTLYHQISHAEAIYSFSDFITQDERTQLIISRAKIISQYDYPILICGETGCGKEIIAHSIHMQHYQNELRPFVRINCNSIPEQLLESELFGYEKGAFAGAQTLKRGKFEIAGNGTILLDEIGNMDIQTQAKLLRVIEEREFERVGGNTLIPLKARIIATTNCDIQKKIQEGSFRLDLYYRLSSFVVTLPPLRERINDIEPLVNHFLKEVDHPCEFSPDAIEYLKRYDWPGNVRQLHNLIINITTIEDCSLISKDIVREHLNESIGLSFQTEYFPGTMRQATDSSELSALLKALESTNYNISATAKILHISRNTVYNRLRRYNIDLPKKP
ncbi:MAG: sigma 54-interacting transcriptional regulator, partial [Clostridiales bacterium]|nr:sigma 54-interacting transcriptional regulator [Clostridiales bacterium]